MTTCPVPSGRRDFLSSLIALVLTAATCALGQDPPSSNPQSAEQPVPGEKRTSALTVADGFRLAAVGDLIVPGPLSLSSEVRLKSVEAVLRDADVTFGNLENTLIDLQHFHGYPQAESGGGQLSGSPDVAKDLRSIGFSMVSRANNHTMDWGIEGMRETDSVADAAGLVHAGTGENRAAARAAHYLDTAKGRVALISMASSFTPMSAAGDPLGAAPGRPGLNALHVTPYVIVTPEMMQGLRRIWKAQPKELVSTWTGGLQEKPNELELFDVHYRVGDKAGGLSYEMSETDSREILQSIRKGKENADFLIATIHAHEPDIEEPADFLPKLAHACIDAGADAFIGHGPHRLRAIEIYHGKPIFYSLGNFFFQLTAVEPLSRDTYEAFKVDPAAFSDKDLMAKIIKMHFNQPLWYESVIAVSQFDHGELSEVRLYPVELNYSDRNNKNGGIPQLADLPMAQSILERLQKLSAPYGTTIEIVGSIGVIRLRAK